jgi:transposase
MLCVEQLPDDPATLKRMLVERDSQLEVIHARHATEIQVAVDEAVQAAVEEAVAKTTREVTAYFLRRFYGPRNERFDPRQLLLFGRVLAASVKNFFGGTATAAGSQGAASVSW